MATDYTIPKAEYRDLVDENAKLKASNEVIAEDHAALCEQNARLRELVRDMLMCLTWTSEPHGYMEGGCNHCRFRGKTHGMCGLGMFRGRSAELGVEVP